MKNSTNAATAPQPICAKVDALLSKLDGVRAIGDGKWLAKCPAHNDRSPSLSVKSVDDKILIRCFAGCGTESVLGALGLTFNDLFTDKITPDYDRHKRQETPRFSRYDLFPKLILEACILHVAISDLLAGGTLSQIDLNRVNQAMNTIWNLRSEVDR